MFYEKVYSHKEWDSITAHVGENIVGIIYSYIHPSCFTYIGKQLGNC